MEGILGGLVPTFPVFDRSLYANTEAIKNWWYTCCRKPGNEAGHAAAVD